MRHFAYDRNFLSVHSVPVPVISIGNLLAGGTGKTPLTLFFARRFSSVVQVAILLRGYKSQAIERGAAPRAFCWEKGERPLPEEVGDEAILLAKNCPQSWVIVGKDRLQSAQLASDLGAQLILLDDGMQHRRLHRDFEWVVIDAARPLDHFLPLGRLREIPERLQVADCLLFTRCEEQALYERAREKIAPYSSAPHLLFRTSVQKPRSLLGQTPLPLKVALFCAIGFPDSFFQLVAGKLKREVVYREVLPDHAYFSLAFLKRFARKSKQRGARALLCTEKDWVKLPSPLSLPLPIFYLPICFEEIAAG